MLESVKRLALLFSRKNRFGFLVLLCLMFIGAILETLGVGAIPVFVSVIALPEQMLKYPYLNPMLTFFDLTTAKQLLIYAGIGLILVFAVKNAYISFVYYLQARFTKNRQVDLGRRLFSLYLHAPYPFHLNRDSSELLRNVNQEVQRVIKGILNPFQAIVMQGLVLLCVAALLLITEPIITIFAGIVLGGASILFLKGLHARTKRKGREAQKERQRSLQAINQGLGGIKEVLVSGNSRYFIDRFIESLQRMTAAEAFRQVAEKLSQPFLECIIVLGILAVAFALLFMGRPLETIAPTLALFGAALIRLKSCVNTIVASFTNFRYNAVAIHPIWNDIHALNQKGPLNAGSVEVTKLRKAIVLENIRYRYPGSERLAVKNINLSILRGSSIALVGPTGSGKTTLVDILLGLLKPETGRILADGRNIFENISTWHSRIGYVPQNIYLLNDSIKNNIAFGVADREIDHQKLDKALQSSQLETFVSELPLGVDTVVGERGVRISGGQRQRIGIARALYHNPEILIMDEATAALDNTTEEMLVRAIDRMKKDRTIIIIAHRLSTVKNCDRLYFMENGKITASGKYEELMSACDAFRQMAK